MGARRLLRADSGLIPPASLTRACMGTFYCARLIRAMTNLAATSAEIFSTGKGASKNIT
jgi:hypothetical protein